MSANREQVTVMTTGGFVVLDITASYDAGLLDSDLETSGDVLAAVRKAIDAGDALLDDLGWPILVVPGSVTALRYWRAA